MLEALFRGFQEFGILDIEIEPRTYHRVPVSANAGYSASLGILAALALHVVLQEYRNLVLKRKREPFLLFIIFSNVFTLVLALTSFFIIMTGTPTKYVIGAYIPVVSLTIALHIVTLLKRHETRVMGFFIIVLALALSSLLSLTSPLKTSTNYRAFQGSIPALDYDIDFAITLSNLMEYRPVENYVIIQYIFPTKGPQEHNIAQALAVYVPLIGVHVIYRYNESLLYYNLIFNYWVYTLGYK